MADRDLDSRSFTIKSVNSEKQVVYGEVYIPNYIDTDGETITEDDVEKMAWDFLSSGKVNKIDVQHNGVESGARVVESFIAREGDPTFVPKAWVLGVQLPDELWNMVKEGKLNGFSLAASVNKYPAKVLVEVAKQIVGETEPSDKGGVLPPHVHNYIVNLDNDGRIVSGKTDAVLGHSHEILASTRTEKSFDHTHRIVLTKEG